MTLVAICDRVGRPLCPDESMNQVLAGYEFTAFQGRRFLDRNIWRKMDHSMNDCTGQKNAWTGWVSKSIRDDMS